MTKKPDALSRKNVEKLFGVSKGHGLTLPQLSALCVEKFDTALPYLTNKQAHELMQYIHDHFPCSPPLIFPH